MCTHINVHTQNLGEEPILLIAVLPGISLGSNKPFIKVVKSIWYAETVFSGKRQLL